MKLTNTCAVVPLIWSFISSETDVSGLKIMEVSFLAPHGHKVPQSLLISEAFLIVCVVVFCLLLNLN